MINSVINESRIDFEDSGIDEATLQELRDVWQQRLTGLNVAAMPWDPAATGIPDNGSLLNDPFKTEFKTEEPFVKQEPLEPVDSLRPSQEEAMGPNSTRLETPTNNNGGLVLPGGGQITQTDGAADLPLTTEQIDKIIAYKLKHTDAKTLEKKNPKLEINLTTDKLDKLLQTDGADDQSDDINSDLDDSEDDINSAGEEDDDDGGMIMLCLYDKVQRVKNKWKYVLKDGIANINGKDYVFSRGSGESEW